MTDWFESFVQETKTKFDYALTTLAFASLALSVQFSPAMGTHFPYVLISAWAFILFSAICGGYRLMRQTVFYNVNLRRNQLTDHVGHLTKLVGPVGGSGAVLEAGTGRRIDPSEVTQALEKKKAAAKKLDVILNDMNQEFPRFFRLQFWSLIVGLLMNMIFASANFLGRIP